MLFGPKPPRRLLFRGSGCVDLAIAERRLAAVVGDQREWRRIRGSSAAPDLRPGRRWLLPAARGIIFSGVDHESTWALQKSNHSRRNYESVDRLV